MSKNQSVETVETPSVEIETPETVETETETETVEEFSLESLVRTLADGLSETDVTPYAIHVLVNSTFVGIEYDKVIRPQMMYNYDRNGLIAKGLKGVKKYTREQAIQFTIKYVTKHSAK